MEAMRLRDWLLVNRQQREADALPEVERRRSAEMIDKLEWRYCEAWQSPGVAELRAIAELEGEPGGLSEAWVRKCRSRMLKGGGNSDDIDGMRLPKFADLVRPHDPSQCVRPMLPYDTRPPQTWFDLMDRAYDE